MGGFLSDIHGRTITVDTALLNLSHSKLIQFYSSYRSICQGFTISIAQYTQIFGANQLSFSVWDTKYRGKIDAIEMFSGLIIFSKIKYEQKIKFLFEIFDFNEEGILNYQNIAFLIINVCNATYKVLSITKTISQVLVESFLDQYFTKETEVQYPRLLRWTAKNQQTLIFFREIGYQIESVMEEKRFDDYSYEQAIRDRKKPKKVDLIDKELKIDQKFIAILDSLVDKQQNTQTQNLNFQLHWIYGIQICPQNLKFMKVQKQKAGNQRIIYSVGRIIIIYFPKLNLQKYYKGHYQPVSVIEISSSKKIAASAEKGQYPTIHIWDIEKRQSLIKFKRIHKTSIKFMRFFKNDRYLATACESVKQQTLQTPIIILKLDSQQIILSTYIKLQIINIQLKEAQLDREAQLLLVSHTSICLVSEINKAFKIQNVQLLDEKQQQIEQIKASLFHPKGWYITAHQNRKFMQWSQKNRCSVIEYSQLSSEEVLQLVLIGDRILCILDQFDIQFVQIKIGQNYPFISSRLAHLKESRLFNMRLQCMQLIEDCNLLVMSQFGDVIKITQIGSGSDFIFQKYYQIFKIQGVSNCYSYNTNNIIFTTPRFLYLVDRFQKELRVLAKQQFQIEHSNIDNDHLVITNPFDGRNTYLRLISLQNFVVRQVAKIGSSIVDIKIVENYIIALSETSLYVFHKTQDKYFQREPSLHKTTATKLCSMALQADQHQLLILSQNKEIYRFPLNGNSPFQLQKIQKIQENPIYKQLTIQYPEQNHRYPFLIKGNQKLVAMGKKNGQLLFWQSLNQAANYHSSMVLTYNSQRISHLLLSKNCFFSVGSADGMVTQLQHRPYLQVKQKDQFEVQSQIGQKSHLNPGERAKSKQNDSKKPLIIKQLQGLSLREGQVQISGLLEPDNSDIRQIIHQILMSKDKTLQKNLFQQFSKQGKPCKTSLQTTFIFGINTNKYNGGVYYIHSYPAQPPQKKRINQSYWQNSCAQQGNKEELQFSKNLLLPLDEDHANCKKQILFSADRYCIISNKAAAQNIYDFHRRKVSALAVHPNKQIICSCQVSATFPKIHIWKHEQRATINVLTSKHRSVIAKAEFSRDGEWIVTLGGVDKAQSIQIFDWLNQQSLGFKCVQNTLIKQILFNPYDKKELCVAGENIIQIYRIEEQLIFIKEQCIVPQQNFLAAVYTSNVYGSEVESDIITGSQEGDIGLYVCGSFLYSRKKAHQGGITCLRLAQLFKYKRVLLSGGRDGFVRLWDIKFNEISKKNIKQQLYSLKNSTNLMPNCSIISLDVFHCQKKQGNELSLSTLLLIATSDGSILEATISNEFQGYKAVVISTAQTQDLKQKINFDISVALSAPSNQYTYKFVVCNNMLITYSNKINFLYFWNIHFHTREKILPLSSPPLFVATLNAQPIILVGQQYQSTFSVKMLKMEWAAGTYLRSVTQCGIIEVQKGNLYLKGAYASKNDSKLALIIKIDDYDEVLIYEKQQSEAGNIRYIFRFMLEEKVPNFLNRVGWIQFSANEQNMIIAWYESKNEASTDFQTKYKCYSSNNGAIMSIGFFQFQKFDFSSKIKASYVPCYQLAGLSQKDYMLKDNLPITAMTEYEGCLFMGTINGQILIVECQAFAKRQAENKYYARSYIITDNPINKLQIRENDLIVGSESGVGVFIVKIKTDKGLLAIEGFKDVFNENINGQQWQKKIKQVYQKRRKIESEDQYICKGLNVDLQLSAVIGRNAFYKRNNIFIDLKDNIISHSGCNILIMKKQQGLRLSQRTIKPDVSLGTTHPQISSICLGECKKFLLVGTSEQSAKIIAWDISTNTYLFDIKLNGFVEVNLIKLCSSNRYCLTLVTTRFKIQYLLFIDVFARTVLAVHNFHRPSQINDFCFGIDQEFRIVSCGVNYMAQWKYCNNILMENHYKLNSGQESQEVKIEPIIFYSIIFIGQYAITSGSDGYLYVWKEQKLIKKQNAHPKQPILSLYTSINSKIFVSGANNGTVIIWHFSQNLIIQRVDQYNIYNGKQAKVPPKYHVQSICMTKQSLIVGNRAGQILYFLFPVGQQSQQKSAIANKSSQLILASFDHEKIISCAFNASSRKLYIMTQAEEGGVGTFAVLDVDSLQRIKQQKVDLKSGLVRMIACKGSPKILVILKNSILTYNYQAEIKDDKFNKFQRRKEFAKFDNILAAAINHNQTFLAVLYAKADTKHPILEFFSLSSISPQKQFYAEYKVQIPNNIEISHFDFCVDHDYVLLQNKQEEQVIIDLMNKKKVSIESLENPPQWNEDLKKTSPNIKQISNFYSEDNQLLKLALVMNKSIIATDQMGSLRLFKYPIEQNKEQEYKVYIHHLNHIYICILSHDNTTLATVSREDRAILLWQVVHGQ